MVSRCSRTSCRNIAWNDQTGREDRARFRDSLEADVNATVSLMNIDQMTTLAEIARLHALHQPPAVALSYDGRDTTYAQFHSRSNQVANALMSVIAVK